MVIFSRRTGNTAPSSKPPAEEPVHEHTVQDRGDEGENLKWFAANDKGSRTPKDPSDCLAPNLETLKPIVGTTIPTLPNHVRKGR